jgi:hypothetical protein
MGAPAVPSAARGPAPRRAGAPGECARDASAASHVCRPSAPRRGREPRHCPRRAGAASPVCARPDSLTAAARLPPAEAVEPHRPAPRPRDPSRARLPPRRGARARPRAGWCALVRACPGRGAGSPGVRLGSGDMGPVGRTPRRLAGHRGAVGRTAPAHEHGLKLQVLASLRTAQLRRPPSLSLLLSLSVRPAPPPRGRRPSPVAKSPSSFCGLLGMMKREVDCFEVHCDQIKHMAF